LAAHADALDQSDRLGGAFWGSLGFHISLAALILGFSIIQPNRVKWGDPAGGGFGAVGVTPVASIPLPARSAPANPVANDTESQVPPTPAKAKPQPKKLPPIPNAVAIPSRNATKKLLKDIPPAPVPNKWAAAHPPAPNQLTSSYGQRANSPMYNMPGGGGVGVGTSSSFGTQFGAYATLLRDKIAQNWRTNDVDARVLTAPPVVVVFTIRRNGALVPNSARVSQSSGNRALDLSTLRAIMDAAPFQELPPGYNKDQAELELRFELRR
jgi:TonB family protein